MSEPSASDQARQLAGLGDELRASGAAGTEALQPGPGADPLRSDEPAVDAPPGDDAELGDRS